MTAKHYRKKFQGNLRLSAQICVQFFVLLLSCRFASGAEMEMTDRLSVDGSSLFKSTAVFSGSVGIGTVSPTGLFQVGSGSLTVLSNGNIGIGTTNPGYKFHVDSTQSGDNTIATFESAINSGGEYNEIRFSAAGNTSPAAMRYLLGTSPNSSELSFHISTNAAGMVEVMRLDKNGNVGIGTTTPAGKLDVEGTLRVGATGTITAISATGGTITTSGSYTIHTFTASGTFTPNGPATVEYLVVGGGGGGGGALAGGGGGGGFITGTGFSVSAHPYTIIVGDGGTGGGGYAAGSSGGNSSFGNITAAGGGGGGGWFYDGKSGGSGGGGQGLGNNGTGNGGAGNTPATSPSQGNNGGSGATSNNGAGGGGAGAVGGNVSGTTSGAGGSGATSSISGSPVTYAGGGGGGARSPYTPGASGSGGGTAGTGDHSAPANALPNTGGGGGGSGWDEADAPGGNGGSGVVIIRYLTASVVDTNVYTIKTTAIGNVGIGTTSPNAKLQVSGQIYQDSAGTKMIFKKPSGTCSACGPNDTDVWTCAGVPCP